MLPEIVFDTNMNLKIVISLLVLSLPNTQSAQHYNPILLRHVVIFIKFEGVIFSGAIGFVH